MLTIRPEQIEALNAAMRERYIARAVEHLRELFPEEMKERDDAQARALVEEGIERAAAYNITSERETTLFIDLMVAIGPDFDTQRRYRAWMPGILRSENLTQQQKMELVYQRLESLEQPA